jgi:hypothetical protein
VLRRPFQRRVGRLANRNGDFHAHLAAHAPDGFVIELVTPQVQRV